MVSKPNILYLVHFNRQLDRTCVSICSRFEHIINNNSPETDSDEDALKYYIKVIQLIRADLQKAIDNYDKLFIK